MNNLEFSEEEALPEVLNLKEDTISRQESDTQRQRLEEFRTSLENIEGSEAKLLFVIEFMEKMLSQSGAPHFKSFWEARGVCLELFKESISPKLRTLYWSKCEELSKEARRLRDLLDEESAFACEQIEIAIRALEGEISDYENNVLKNALPIFEIVPHFLRNTIQLYQQNQNQLNSLNVLASRITGLRKELIRTNMRIRQKNKFFERLSYAGDQVFPKRKELIKKISDLFLEDVEAFVQKNFSQEGSIDAFFFLREEIKGLQNLAKELTLNTHAFTHIRLSLSKCWDQLKNLEKEKKKERAQQKLSQRQNLEEIQQKLQVFNSCFLDGSLSTIQANQTLGEISSYVRRMDLGREELQIAKEGINSARKLIKEKEQEVERTQKALLQEKENSRRQSVQEIRNMIQELLNSNSSAEILLRESNSLQEKLNSLGLNRSEKVELERQLKRLKDLISERQESSLLSLSDNDREALAQLREVLRQRMERRQESKLQLELLRKAAGSSGLDFMQALAQNAQVEAEKERLDKIIHGIKEVEQKIEEIEKRK